MAKRCLKCGFPDLVRPICHKCAEAKIERLQAENARLREALGFYAEVCNWDHTNVQDSTRDVAAIDASDEELFPPDYLTIGGKRARAALAATGKAGT